MGIYPPRFPLVSCAFDVPVGPLGILALSVNTFFPFPQFTSPAFFAFAFVFFVKIFVGRAAPPVPCDTYDLQNSLGQPPER